MKVNTPPQAAGACAVLLTMLIASACSSSSTHANTTPTPPTSAVAQPTSAPPLSPAPASSAAAGAADAATTAAVRHAYETFFDYRTPPRVGVTLLQDGPAFASVMQAAAAAASKQKITVQVTGVSTVSAKVSKVAYSLFLAGRPTLRGASGFAVLENGGWKVAGSTFCGLLNLNGSNPLVCKNPKAIALPS